MGLVTDVFNGNAWGTVDFQEQMIERTDFRPQLLGQLGIFEPVYSRSRNIAIADRNRTLSLIPTSEMGAPPEELIPEGSKVRVFQTSRLAKGSTIYAAELAGVTALPFDVQTREITQEVSDRSAQIMNDLELTWERMRLGALSGSVLDVDGSVIVNWFTEWGVAPPTPIDFALDVETTNVRQKIRQIKRDMMVAAKGRWTPGVRIAALCDSTFYDALVAHKSYTDTKMGTERAATLENIEGYSTIDFEGVSFIDYRGTDDGTTISIPEGTARFFPIGMRGAFKAGFSPANEFKPYLNQRAREYYGLMLADTSGREAWDRVEVYSYPLMIAAMPEMILTATA